MERVLFAHRVLPALPPDVAQDPGPFDDWVRRQEAQRPHQFAGRPDAEMLQLVMAIAGEPPPETVRTLHALQQQTSARWKLTVVLHDAGQTAFTALLAVSGLQRTSQRVRVERVDDATALDEMLRRGLAANAGSNLSVLFPGDVWAPDAVAQLAGALSARAVVYADEDLLSPDGSHTAPRLKPAYSPDFLLSSAYLGRPLAIGSDLAFPAVGAAGAPAELEHDLALRACEVADEVIHLPHVLCHRLLGPPDGGGPPGVADVTAALHRRGEPAEVAPGPHRGTYRIRRHAVDAFTVTLIIPFRDQPQFLRTCIESIDATRGIRETNFVLVDNGSVQPETLTLVERLTRRDDLLVLRDERPFNWSELNNAGAEVATGDVLVFLNNDIEARHAGWLDALAIQARRPEVGAVGARLLYPDRRLQHGGVVIGVGGAADHIQAGLGADEPGYLNMAISTRECGAVTGACLATRRDVFDRLGGFDEALGVDLNDIDYCLRVQRSGLKVLYEATAELLHHESPSRGFAGGARDIKKFIDRWQTTILAGDPYLSPNLTRIDSSCALRRPDEGEWWHQWYAKLFPKLSDHLPSSEPAEEPAPRMFQRSTDVPGPLPSVRHGDQVATLHREWVRVASVVDGEDTSVRQRLGRLARRVTGRGAAGIDRGMIADLIRAVDAVAERCDALTERLAHHDVVLDDVVTIYGEELTRLRVELAALAAGMPGASPPRPIPHE